MKIHLLNHASVIIETREVKLLSDPWFWGTCFNEGWGLKYNNEKSFELAKGCTHLWISHFHADHFHIHTLTEIVKLNPDIIVFGNHSLNFQMDSAIRKVGFKNIIPLYERIPFKLTNSFEVVRFPTTGIDNILFVKTDEGVVLNYNDCVIPPLSRKMLAKKIGKIDIFLNNYNHAGKLLKYPLPTDEQIKRDLKKNFINNFLLFKPKWIIPFASYHYYCAEENWSQNNSLLELEALLDIDERIIPLHIGECAEFDLDTKNYKITRSSGNVVQNRLCMKNRSSSYTFSELKLACDHYCKSLKRGFIGLTFFLQPLKIKVDDLNICVEFHPRRGLREVINTEDRVHIAAHSEALFKWFSDPFGTDTFVVGAHFSILDGEVLRLKWLIVFGLLVENKLDLRSILKMLITWKGLRFLLNRREEISGILTSWKIGAEYQR
jgi:hypothetical protein